MTEQDSHLVALAGFGIIILVVLMAMTGFINMDDSQQFLPIEPYAPLEETP